MSQQKQFAPRPYRTLEEGLWERKVREDRESKNALKKKARKVGGLLAAYAILAGGVAYALSVAPLAVAVAFGGWCIYHFQKRPKPKSKWAK